MGLIASLSSNHVTEYVGVAVLVWLILSALTAGYGGQKGYPFFPLLLVGLLLGPLGWALVLLGVALAAGPVK